MPSSRWLIAAFCFDTLSPSAFFSFKCHRWLKAIMPIYRLECILRFYDGRSGSAVDGRNIQAVSPMEAIAIAKNYDCNKPSMVLSLASLYNSSQDIIWSFRSDISLHSSSKPATK